MLLVHQVLIILSPVNQHVKAAQVVIIAMVQQFTLFHVQQDIIVLLALHNQLLVRLAILVLVQSFQQRQEQMDAHYVLKVAIVLNQVLKLLLVLVMLDIIVLKDLLFHSQFHALLVDTASKVLLKLDFVQLDIIIPTH